MATYQKTSQFKRGDTFGITCIYEVEGIPTALTSQTLASQLRAESGKLINNLVCTKDADQTNNPGVFYLTLAIPSNSNLFPAPADVYCDIQITTGATVNSSSTFIIPVVVDITR